MLSYHHQGRTDHGGGCIDIRQKNFWHLGQENIPKNPAATAGYRAHQNRNKGMNFILDSFFSTRNREQRQPCRIQCDAVADGLDSKAMRSELIEMERRVEQLEIDAKVEKTTSINVIELHPQLPALYERKVKALREALMEGEAARAEAIGALRAIITDITVKPGAGRGEVFLELHGSIPAVLAFASAKEGKNHDSTVLMVAAECSGLYRRAAQFRLTL